MVPHFVVERKLQFVRKLVVAVQIDLFRGESRFEGRVQFPCGHGVHADVFRIRNFIDGKAGKRLGSVQHESVAVVFLLDRIAIDRTHIADILFVHHIQRRPETLCQSNGIRPADLKVSCSFTLNVFLVFINSITSRDYYIKRRKKTQGFAQIPHKTL